LNRRVRFAGGEGGRGKSGAGERRGHGGRRSGHGGAGERRGHGGRRSGQRDAETAMLPAAHGFNPTGKKGSRLTSKQRPTLEEERA
jgi:hypothetical protein